MTYTFDDKRRQYLSLHWDSMKITRERSSMQDDTKKLLAHKPTYRKAEAATGVPWWMIAVIDMREGGIEHLGTRHLHDGDVLTNYTTNYPPGRPHVRHGPPFTWLESAIDALTLQGYVDKKINWTIERVLHQLEPYNGLAYWTAGRPSPYIWSCTSVYDPPTGPGGKVEVDHGPIVNSIIDKQSGCAPVIKLLAEIDPTITFAREFTPVPPVVVPHPVEVVVPLKPSLPAPPKSWWASLVDRIGGKKEV